MRLEVLERSPDPGVEDDRKIGHFRIRHRKRRPYRPAGKRVQGVDLHRIDGGQLSADGTTITGMVNSIQGGAPLTFKRERANTSSNGAR